MNREQLFEGIGGLDEALLVRSEGRAQSRESKQLKWDEKTGRKTLWCMEIATGECWQVQKNHETTIYDMETDGEWMFTCVPWSEEQVCWRLAYDESGRPTALELVSGDIAAR